EDAFRLIFQQHNRFIFRFIYGMVGDRDLAEELTQETFMGAYRNRATLRDDVKPSTWLCAIAKNLSRSSLRSRRREISAVGIEDQLAAGLRDSESPLPDAQLLNKELNRVIHDALAELDEDKRLVFTLKVLRQCSYEEMSEIAGSSIAKLKTDLYRAKAEMRQRIRRYLEASDEV
ncbi:MAG TPA: RNA polymerase sigma factor, partial [Candidatus Paceibacterota bacterium]|nr:RNA polymerase sigma factor [Candidatus Paceibacterota bacterium]